MSSASSGGVAIVGMSCLFPGAPDLDAYWRNILGKVDAVSDPPPEAWDADVYYDPGFRNKDATYCKRGGYLGSLASFDALAHGIPPVAVGGEPDQWLALQIAHDALADAGALELSDAVRRRTQIVLGKGTYLNGGNAIAVQRGLVVGETVDLIRRLHPEHSEAQLERLREELQKTLPPLGPDTVPGLIPNIIVGRIANRLDLMGPAYTVDAACASSLVAIQHAVRDLRAGECDLALAGGAQVWMPVATLNLFCRLGALSRDQQIRPFDETADGTLLGEGIGMVVLKRAEDAFRDGDRVYAVIRGVGVASDGRGAGVMAPRPEGEELALRRAYEAAGVDPSTVGLIEAHGTGTPLGDAIEIASLTKVFGERAGEVPRVAIGTVKSMISHTIPAAGVAGVIKAALSLHHRVLPPTLHFERASPKLGLDASPFYVNTETRPWVHGHAEPRRAGVNAFGFGGINAHAVLEEPPTQDRASHRPPWGSELFLLEAATPEALAGAADALATAVEPGPAYAIADLAATLAGELGGVAQPLRLAVVAESFADLRAKLGHAVEKLRSPKTKRIKAISGIYYASEPLARDGGKVVLVFPGEGAQYPDMLAELCLHFDEARAVFDRIDRLYADHPRGDLLSDWVFPATGQSPAQRRRAEERLMQLDIAVESVLTANGAMHAVLSRLLGRIDAVVGHSTGEHSAAMVTGVLDTDTDERLVEFSQGLYRAYAAAAERHDIPGAVLLALGTGREQALELAAEAGGELYLAMDNCPHQAVLVGPPDPAARAREIAAREGVVCEVLPYDRAVHTPLFAPFADDLRAVFGALPIGEVATELWSCTTAAPYPRDPDAIRELLAEHWTSPVRFRETIEALYDDGARLFVECGPRGNMTAFVEDVLRGRPHCAVASDLRRRGGVTQLNHLVGQLAVHGADVDVTALFAQRAVRRVDWRAGGEPEPDRPRIPLSTAWPMLTLSDDALDRIGAAPAPSPAAPVANGNGAGQSNGGNGHAPAAPLPPGIAAPDVAVTGMAPYVAPAAAAPAPAAPGAAEAALADHLRTMETFLDASREVMAAFLAPGAAPAPAAYPLLGDVVATEPGVSLVARRVVDPAEDVYLSHHTLGSGVSRADPALTGLAVMPLAMSLELLAEAAAALVPGHVVTGLVDVRAHRWLAWGEAPRTLELAARRVAGDGQGEHVLVELRDLGESGTGQSPAVVRGIVRLERGHRAAPARSEQWRPAGRPSTFTPGELYGEAMFHQPLWQGVHALDTVAPGGAVARLRVLDPAGLLASDPAPAFQLDPVVLDAAGQVIGFWAAEVFDRGRVVFPFRMASLDVHGPRPAPGTELTCVAAIETLGDLLVRSDIDVLDPDGRSWLRLTGWEDKRFDVPDRFRPLTVPTELPPISSAWEAPVALAGRPGVAARRLDTRLPADGALWGPAWARRVLNRAERARFDALTRSDARRLEWLGARTAAKEAVAHLLRTAQLLDPLHADVEIDAAADGRPVVRVAGLEHAGIDLVVSLAHAQGEAAALAAIVPRGSRAGVGLDLEPLRALPEGFAELGLEAPAQAALASVGAQARDEWLLRCWCGKEATGKALGTGLVPGTPTAPRIAAVDVGTGVVTVDAGGARVLARTARDGDLIVATAVWDGPDGDAHP